MRHKNNPAAQIDFEAKVPYVSFPALSHIPYIRHGFSTKLGGVSEGIFASMNLGADTLAQQDSKLNILTNYERIADAIGVEADTMVISHQVHKTKIKLVTKDDCGKGLYQPRDYEEIDGFICNQSDVTLVTKYADCVPLFFVDTKNKAIGLSHAGWRGTVGKIGAITVESMREHFGTLPEDLTIVIGPSICQDCYEIGEEVAREFQSIFTAEQLPSILKEKENKKYLLHLWNANKAILMNAGVPESQIHISGVCTSCNSDIFFSHRKTQGKRGSLAAFLSLKLNE